MLNMLRQNDFLLNRRVSFSVAAVAVMFLFMFGPLNHYLLQSLYESNYYRLGIPMLVAIYLAVRGFRDGTEMRILILYLFWAIITRILNGDRFLLVEGDYLIDLSTMILLFAPGILLHREERYRFFRIVSAIIVVFYFVMAIICIYTAATRSYIENPIDYRGIGFPSWSPKRLSFLSFQWNETAGQFVIAFGLCLILFFRIENILARIGLVFAAAADYITVGLTLSRNGQTCVSLAAGLMLAVLAVHRLNNLKLWKRIAAFLGVLLVSVILFYQLFEPCRFGLWKIHQKAEQNKAVEVSDSIGIENQAEFFREDNWPIEEQSMKNDKNGYHADERGYLDSGRKQIFWSAVKSLQIEPKRLLIGSGYYQVMDISHILIKEQAKHFHNTFLQVVNEYGMIGLALAVWFYLRMLMSSIRILFTTGSSLAEKMLILLPIAMMFYYMLEVGIFKIVDTADFRNTFFFFICGILTGAVKENTT